MIDKYDAAVLRSLRERFGVDVSPAEGLTGPELQAWLYRAEDELFERLMAEREKERCTVKRPAQVM